MKICPSCHEEFLDHIEFCAHCKERVVDEASVANKPKSTLASKEEILHNEPIAFMEGSLSNCREIEKILKKSDVSCAVYPVSLASQSNPATLGAATEMKYMLLLKESDIEKAKVALEGQFHDQVAKEGKGELSREIINLDEEFITCPACKETIALKDGECPECGLYLGEHP